MFENIEFLVFIFKIRIDKFVCELYYIKYTFMINQKRADDILYLIKYLSKILDTDLDNRLAEYGLTGQQGRILFYINKETNCLNRDVHQFDIEREFHLSKSTVSGLVKRMEKKGVISIEKKHPYANIKIEDAGKNIICHLRTHRDEAIAELSKDLSEEEKEQVIKLLNRMINNMEGGQ